MAIFTVTLTPAAGPGGVTFDVATANGTALAGIDYVASNLTGQTIPAGASNYLFQVATVADMLQEQTETFLVNVTNIVGATVIDGQGIGTIIDDDVAAPTANDVVATVAYGGSQTITPDITGGTATSVAVATPTHGTAAVNGMSMLYTPAVGYAGPDSFSYTATGPGGTSPPATVTITVSPPTIAYTPANPAPGTVGVAYSQSLAGASGGAGPYAYAHIQASGPLPSGLTLDSDGTLHGTPAADGTFDFTVIATDSSSGSGPFSSAPAAVLVTIGAAAPTIASLAPSNGSTAGGTSVTITGTHLAGATAATFGGVPATDLVVNSATSITVTTPAHAAGPVDVAVTTAGGSDTLAGAFTYEAPASNDASLANLVISAGALNPAFASGVTNYTASVPYTVGSLVLTPTAAHAGATITVDGQTVGSGSPSSAIALAIGDTAIAVVVTAQDQTTRTYTVTVARAEPTIAIDPGALPDGEAGSVYGPVTLTADGGAAPYAFAVTAGNLPEGLSLGGTGGLTGTPTEAGSFPVTVTATDDNGFTGSQPFLLSIRAPEIDISVPSIPEGKVNTPFTAVQLSASGGVAPYAFSVAGGRLPGGVVLAADGRLSGTPTQAGNFTATVAATDSLGFVGTAGVSLRINKLDVPVAQDLTLEVMAGTNGSIDLTQGATNGPFTRAAIAAHPVAEAGRAAIRKDGAAYMLDFAAAATFEGSASLQYTLSNANGRSAPATVTLNIIARPDPSQDPDVIGLLTAQAEAAKRFARTQTQNFNQRLEQLHDEGERRRNSMNANMSLQRRDSERAAYARDDERNRIREAFERVDAHGKERAKPSSNTSDASDDHNPLGKFAVWSGGFVNFAEADNGSIDLDSTLVGMSGGVDYRFTPTFVAGLGFGYGRDKTDVGANGTESLGQAWSMAAYGSYKPTPEIFIDGLIGYSLMNFDSRRYISATGDFAMGSRDGQQVFGSLTAGYEHRRDGWLLSPYGRLELSRSRLDAFTENGGGIWDLTYGHQTIDTLSGILGLRLEYAMPMDWGVLKPRARVEYTHDFEGSSRVSVGYADIGTLPYVVETEPFSKDHLTVGLGFDAQIGDGWTIGFDYRTAYGSGGRQQDHTFAVKVGAQF